MTKATVSKRFALAGWSIAALLLIVSCILVANLGLLQLRTAYADEQTKIFESMRARSLETRDPLTIIANLEYTLRYYPSGTKQPAPSRLDRVVERQRTSAIRDIIQHLRATTGLDLGNSPESWIKHFKNA